MGIFLSESQSLLQDCYKCQRVATILIYTTLSAFKPQQWFHNLNGLASTLFFPQLFCAAYPLRIRLYTLIAHRMGIERYRHWNPTYQVSQRNIPVSFNPYSINADVGETIHFIANFGNTFTSNLSVIEKHYTTLTKLGLRSIWMGICRIRLQYPMSV
jgi:hypothetical protein